VDERKNLPEHETLIRRFCATLLKSESEFTEIKLLYPLRPVGSLPVQGSSILLSGLVHGSHTAIVFQLNEALAGGTYDLTIIVKEAVATALPPHVSYGNPRTCHGFIVV
jgi:hypothetical protein